MSATSDKHPDSKWAELSRRWSTWRENWRPRRASLRQGMLLWTMAIAVERQIPMTTALTALRQDVHPTQRHQLDKLIALIESGVPLADAFEQVPGLLSPESLLTLRVAAESGNLAVMLQAEAQHQNALVARRDYSYRGMAYYIMGVLVAVFVAFFFAMYFVVPKYLKIFDDFGVELPELTEWSIRAAEFSVTFAFLLVPAGVALGWFAVVCAGVLDEQGAGTSRGYPLAVIPPFLRRMSQRQAAAEVLRRLSYVVAAGRPLTGALSTLAKYHSNSRVANALACVYVDCEHGSGCWDAMQRAGLLRQREVSLLQAAERAGNLPWALRQTAERIVQSVDDRCRLAVEYVGPLLLLLTGGLVALYALAMFLPLVALMGG